MATPPSDAAGTDAPDGPGDDPSGSAEGDERFLAGLVFLLLLASYAFFFQGGGWNPNSRLDLTRALVEQGRLEIDDYRGNTGDWARRDGHFYTNKAPGLSFFAVPFYAAATRAADAAGLDPVLRLRTGAYVSNLAVNAIPAALLGVLLLFVLRDLGAGSAVQRVALVVAFGLGTLAFPYATAFYAHQPAAVFGFAGFVALRRGSPRLGGILAGAACGAAVLLEHTTVFVVAALAAVHAMDADGRRRLGWACLGGLPFAVALGIYDSLAFGHPLAGGFAFANPGVEVREDGALFGFPTPSRVGALLFSPFRGLLVVSPLFALAPLGFPALARADRRAAWVCGIVCVVFLLFIASFHAWHGGFSAGPRYLIPALPFLFLPAAFGLLRLPVLAGPLVAVSLALALSITAITVELPAEERNPLFRLVVPLFGQGHVSINTYGFDDLRPTRPWVNDFESFNLGELIFPHSSISVLPLLALQLLIVFFALHRARQLERAAGRRSKPAPS